MNEEIKERINNITSMSDEERKEQLSWSDTHEFGTTYAYFLLEENQKLNKIIDELEKWLNKYFVGTMSDAVLNKLTELKKEVKPHE